MSALAYLRLIVARHLDLEPKTAAALLDAMNILDASLDELGYEPSEAVTDALRRLDVLVVFGEDSEDVSDIDSSDGSPSV